MLPTGLILPIALTAVAGLAACTVPTSYTYLYGQSAPVAGADRTIVITPATRYVNVEGGETIRFVAGKEQFAWTFHVARNVHAFDLNEIAPPGLLSQTVRAYVAPDPKYINVPGNLGE